MCIRDRGSVNIFLQGGKVFFLVDAAQQGLAHNVAVPVKNVGDVYKRQANAFDEDRRNALESGMNGFLSKPIVIGDLVQELRKIL